MKKICVRIDWGWAKQSCSITDKLMDARDGIIYATNR